MQKGLWHFTKNEIKRLINSCSCSCPPQLQLQLVLPQSLWMDGITLLILTLISSCEEIWLCICIPTN